MNNKNIAIASTAVFLATALGALGKKGYNIYKKKKTEAEIEATADFNEDELFDEGKKVTSETETNVKNDNVTTDSDLKEQVKTETSESVKKDKTELEELAKEIEAKKK